jgi:hypothetical protein
MKPNRHLALGLAWPAAFAAGGLVIFWMRTRTRVHTRRHAGYPASRT